MVTPSGEPGEGQAAGAKALVIQAAGGVEFMGVESKGGRLSP